MFGKSAIDFPKHVEMVEEELEETIYWTEIIILYG